MLYLQAGAFSLPPNTPKCPSILQIPLLKSGQAPSDPSFLGSQDFSLQAVSQFVVDIYNFQFFLCSVPSNGLSPPSLLLIMVSLSTGTVWGT